MNTSTLQELEATKQELLQSMRLPDRLARGDAPVCLEQVDISEIRPLLDKAVPNRLLSGGPDTDEFVTDFIERSEAGLRTWLTQEIDLLLNAKESQEEQEGANAFGFFNAVYPVIVEGELAHVLLLGPLRAAAFSDEEIEALAEVSGKSYDEVREAAAHVPVLAPGHARLVRNLVKVARDALQQALAERSAAATANHLLLQAERDRSLGALSGGVAHHFNNLLSVVLGYSSYVLNREEHSKDAAAALRKIAEAAQRGRRLTEEILSFAGTGDEEEQPCRVHESLESVLSLISSELSSSIRVERDFKAASDAVLTTPSSMHQLVFSLLNHAVDSMPDGGVLGVSTENTSIEADGRRQTYLRLEVTDTSGIKPVGPDAPKAGANGGQGSDQQRLRLSNVYGMVGRLDGTVMVTTEPGALTRVEVLLPTIESDAKPRPEKQVKRRLAPSSIWVVDDDEIFREMCEQVLSEEGHKVVSLTGGEQLKQQWAKAKRPPHLIVMDFSMPDFNGLELCEWLKHEGSKVPVILVSGFTANQPDIKKALRIRKTYFLQKPFTSRDLTDAVTLAMGETLIGETLISDL